MRARKWSTTVAVALLAIGLLSACTPKDGRTYPKATDVTRAQKVWADPWLAPDVATTVEPRGSAPNVRRDVAGRSYVTTSSPRAAVAAEVEAAIAAGWRLVGAECAPAQQGFAGNASAQLARGTTTDDGSIATVQASLAQSAAGQAPATQVGIGASVAHHLDATWSAPAPIDVEGSCLFVALPASSPTASAAPMPLSSPVPLSGERVDPPTWSTDPVPDDLRDAMTALGDDASLRSLGLRATAPADTGESAPRRAAMSARAPLKTSVGFVETVTSLSSQGWTLTYAGCIGPGAPNLAELSRSVGKRTAVLRLSMVVGATASLPVDATLVVSTPGYSPDAPAAITEPCFAQSPAPTTFSHKGVPHLGPTRTFPLQP